MVSYLYRVIQVFIYLRADEILQYFVSFLFYFKKKSHICSAK
nr:MAG TPA: hypothetical protein [Caudoviricetes sp.]